MNGYDRALRLKHVRLRGWQREAATWGMVALAVLLALAGLVSPWGIVVLPVAVAGVLKAQDLLAGHLASGAPLLAADEPAEDSNEPPVGATGGSGS